jgi:predicted dehydrogenase
LTKTIEPFSRKRSVESEPRTTEGKIDVALVGAGSFAKRVLLPILTSIPDYNLRAVVTKSGINAKQTALKFKAEYFTTDYKEVLNDESIDLLVITTPHNLHYPMIVNAAKAGKAIYVEKPMCLSEQELDEIVKIVSEKEVPLVVGFNRRYSSLAVKAKELLERKHGPYLINYRINAGFVPRNHWVQDPEVGGGRIIGECCHFIDFFNYIVESEIRNICAMSIPMNKSTVVANDNVIATIKWKDGSLTTLTYTALGDVDLPKERIEFYVGGNSLIIDDFRKMELYGFDGKRRISRRQDKGHYQEFVELAHRLKGERSNLITFEECVEAMKITFEVQKLVKSSLMTKK